MSEEFVEYPRGQVSKAPPAQLVAALNVWVTCHKSYSAGVIGFLLSFIGGLFVTSFSSPQFIIAMCLPVIVGHVLATGNTWRAFAAAKEEFSQLRKWGFVAMLVVFLLPLLGLVVPVALCEWMGRFLRENGIVFKQPKEALAPREALEKTIEKTGELP